jgi:hypothetical protein
MAIRSPHNSKHPMQRLVEGDGELVASVLAALGTRHVTRAQEHDGVQLVHLLQLTVAGCCFERDLGFVHGCALPGSERLPGRKLFGRARCLSVLGAPYSRRR